MAQRTYTLTADQSIVLGPAGGENQKGTWLIRVLEVSGAGTITASGFNSDAGEDAATATVLAYEDMATGETVAGATAISAVGSYRVPADTLDVVIAHASGTSVTFTVNAVREA